MEVSVGNKFSLVRLDGKDTLIKGRNDGVTFKVDESIAVTHATFLDKKIKGIPPMVQPSL